LIFSSTCNFIFLLLSRIKYGIDLAPKYFPSPSFLFLTITEPGRRHRTCFVTSSVPHTRQPTRKKELDNHPKWVNKMHSNISNAIQDGWI
jgi:hypothetical protein